MSDKEARQDSLYTRIQLVNRLITRLDKIADICAIGIVICLTALLLGWKFGSLPSLNSNEPMLYLYATLFCILLVCLFILIMAKKTRRQIHLDQEKSVAAYNKLKS